jgi:hypothetical protein
VKKHLPQKRQDAYHEKKAKASIIMVVHSLNYEKGVENLPFQL